MALIELHPQLTETNKLLDRIARGIERILLEQYGVSIGHCAEPAADPNPKEKESVGYHTDEDTLREDLKALAGYAPHENEQDDSGV